MLRYAGLTIYDDIFQIFHNAVVVKLSVMKHRHSLIEHGAIVLSFGSRKGDALSRRFFLQMVLIFSVLVFFRVPDDRSGGEFADLVFGFRSAHLDSRGSIAYFYEFFKMKREKRHI